MAHSFAFAVGEAGMAFERLRADTAAANIANMHTTRTASGGAFTPLRAVGSVAPGRGFASFMAPTSGLLSLPSSEVRLAAEPAKMVLEPGHPDADDKGFVAYPNVNLVSEMVTLMTASRAYEANVSALNAAKAMALKTLEIGGNR